MGQSLSKEEMMHEFFTSLPEEYINVGIDDSILNYTGIDSTAVLNYYSSNLLRELEDQVPSYIERVGGSLAGFSAVPHAVGVGALVISIILEIAFIATKGSQSNQENPEGMLRRIFAEEKASEVRDLMQEYLKRYSMHLRADHLLLEDTRKLERSLSLQLTRLRNSMLFDGQMNSRALKHWANGAAFHAHMLIHLSRLQKNDAESFEIAKSAARSAIETYSRDTSALLKKYQEYKTSKFTFQQVPVGHAGAYGCAYTVVYKFTDVDIMSDNHRYYKQGFYQIRPQQYTDYIFLNHNQIIRLKRYFVELLDDVPVLCNEEGTFKIRTSFFQ